MADHVGAFALFSGQMCTIFSPDEKFRQNRPSAWHLTSHTLAPRESRPDDDHSVARSVGGADGTQSTSSQSGGTSAREPDTGSAAVSASARRTVDGMTAMRAARSM